MMIMIVVIINILNQKSLCIRWGNIRMKRQASAREIERESFWTETINGIVIVCNYFWMEFDIWYQTVN